MPGGIPWNIGFAYVNPAMSLKRDADDPAAGTTGVRVVHEDCGTCDQAEMTGPRGYRVCAEDKTAVCHDFWEKHRDESLIIQDTLRLGGRVKFVARQGESWSPEWTEGGED
jgi:hypothetical protein